MATRCHLLFYKPFIDKMGLFGIKRVFGKGKNFVVFCFRPFPRSAYAGTPIARRTNDLPAPLSLICTTEGRICFVSDFKTAQLRTLSTRLCGFLSSLAFATLLRRHFAFNNERNEQKCFIVKQNYLTAVFKLGIMCKVIMLYRGRYGHSRSGQDSFAPFGVRRAIDR